MESNRTGNGEIFGATRTPWHMQNAPEPRVAWGNRRNDNANREWLASNSGGAVAGEPQQPFSTPAADRALRWELARVGAISSYAAGGPPFLGRNQRHTDCVAQQ